MTTSEALRAAKEYIRAHGWCQGVFHGENGGVCAVGALRCVAVPHSLVYDEALRGLDRSSGDSGVAVHYNDTPGRTIEDVYAWFDRAIEYALKQEENNAKVTT